MLQNFHKNRHRDRRVKIGSVALAGKRDFKTGPEKRNCYLFGISGNFAKDGRRKETAQCYKCGEKDNTDKACRRHGDWGKHASVAMGSTLVTQDEALRAVFNLWKRAGMLVNCGCVDHIVTNIDVFVVFVPIRSVARGFVRISMPSNKGEIQF